ncbi:MAG TPA: DUF885 domain-containing protein [Candidatus Limnocylindria bacterium]|nr:DUF885 domain-containing protein [Candidatus Limnocylindria bacterium]
MTSSFAQAQDAFFVDFFRLYPVHATEAGNHEHDGRWMDLTDAGRGERLAWLRDVRGTFEGMSDLDREQDIDRRVLLATIDELQFDEDELDEPAWSPIVYTYLLGGGLFGLLSREFAPVGERLVSAASRMEGIPAVVEAARANLTSRRSRPVATFHVEKAIETMPGVADLCRTAVSMAADVDPALKERVTRAADDATASVDAFAAWLRDELLPTADGDFRLGPALYERKFHHALKATITPAELERRASAAYDDIRAEMARIARDLWPAWVGDEPMPDDSDALTRRVLDAIAVDHPKADELLDFCRAEHERILAFVRDRDLIGLPDDPLQIIWTPPFLRAFGGAMLIPPGPLDKGLDSFFAITPPPESWSDEQVESMLRENNGRALKVLTIHEATPGHYLQLAWSNRCQSLPRSVFGSGVFAEGWAVYVTQVMMDVGYAADDPALMLAHWKYFLRAATNTLMDIRIHTGTMTEDEAMALMVDGGFQERSEASEKWNRARLSSTQLCSYYLGSVEMTELENEERRRRGDAFSWRLFLESVVSHGTPPMPVIRDILYGD